VVPGWRYASGNVGKWVAREDTTVGWVPHWEQGTFCHSGCVGKRGQGSGVGRNVSRGGVVLRANRVDGGGERFAVTRGPASGVAGGTGGSQTWGEVQSIFSAGGMGNVLKECRNCKRPCQSSAEFIDARYGKNMVITSRGGVSGGLRVVSV